MNSLKWEQPIRVSSFVPIDSPKIGVVVTTYSSPAFVNLHLQLAQKYYNHLPLLVFDDASDESRLVKLCKDYVVDFRSNTFRLGHRCGDVSGIIQGLSWAKSLGLDLLVKFSRRFVPVDGTWLDTFSSINHTTYSNVCNYWNFGFRTECITFHVNSWFEQIEELRYLVKNQRLDLVEADIHEIAKRISVKFGLEESFRKWEWMKESRLEKNENFFSHWTRHPREYVDFSRRMGILGLREHEFREFS